MASKETVWPDETVNLGEMLRDHLTWPQSLPTWKLFQPGPMPPFALVWICVLVIGNRRTDVFSFSTREKFQREGGTDGFFSIGLPILFRIDGSGRWFRDRMLCLFIVSPPGAQLAFLNGHDRCTNRLGPSWFGASGGSSSRDARTQWLVESGGPLRRALELIRLLYSS